MKKLWFIFPLSLCFLLVLAFWPGHEKPAPQPPQQPQTEEMPEVRPPQKQTLSVEPAPFPPEDVRHYTWQDWQFDYQCPPGWTCRPMTVWQASEGREASPEWGVELLPPGDTQWAILLQGSHRNQKLQAPLQQSMEVLCQGRKVGRLDVAEQQGQRWYLVTLDDPGQAGSAFQIFVRGEAHWPEAQQLLQGLLSS